jgi:hypothetical protein
MVPRFEAKVFAEDMVKKDHVELRALPQIDLYVACPKEYPQHKPAVFTIKGGFYERFKTTIYEKLSELWVEETPVLYQMCMEIEESVQSILEDHSDEIPLDEAGNIKLSFDKTADFEAFIQSSQVAFRRKFDLEEHHCLICARNLLGDKFFFLSGCEHYFCLECIKETVINKINDGQVANIVCPQAGCGKMFNDWDIRHMGLEKSIKDRYE